MNIVVLCGGISSERDVSITSGTMVAKALREQGHKVVLLDAFFGCTEPYERPETLFGRAAGDELILVGEKEPELDKIWAMRRQNNDSVLGDNVLEVCRAADITFFALHGEEGENGRLQAAFDIAGIKYTGSGYLGSALAMNKTLSKKLFECSGILTPDGITVYAGQAPYADAGFPCVVKPCSGGSSIGTSIVNSRSEYDAALALAFKYERAVIVERYIKGRELTVGVIDGQAMPVVEIIPKAGFYDYRNKYQAGLTAELCPAPISDGITRHIQRLSEKVNDILMIEAYCRVDFLMDAEERLFCLEANTLPGMTPTSLIPQMASAQGKSFGELCDEIIAASLKKYR
ncbi:MAG: D-alanine--D-alanine ligase [Oscillospiraceae bacterium]|nr:D-alanine--D-alanine ligase [Oscillospiraceae bacterium]